MPDPAERSHDTYEVTSGKLHHVNNRGERVTLTPGATFQPTIRQAESGSLENKAVKVKEGSPRPSVTVGVDFDGDGNIVRGGPGSGSASDLNLDALGWGSSAAKRKASEEGVTAAEMLEVGATGARGFVSPDVDRALEERS